MNRKELIDALSDKTGSSKADADRNISALIEIVTSTLKKNTCVSLQQDTSKVRPASHPPQAFWSRTATSIKKPATPSWGSG